MAGPALNSLYAAQSPPPRARAPLNADAETDICVIGGGLTGLSTAYELATRGVPTLLVEAYRFGVGASGRNGGQLWPGAAASIDAVVKRHGLERARDMWRLGLEGVDIVRGRVADWALPGARPKAGVMVAAWTAADAAEFDAYQRLLEREFGHRGTRILAREETAEALGSPAYHGGFLDPHGGHLDPLILARRLADEAEAAGARLAEETPAQALRPAGDGYEIETPAGAVRARAVVLACDSYMDGDLAPPGAAPRWLMAKVGTFILATEPLGPAHAGVMALGAAVSDTQFALNYFRKTADGRLLFGGRASLFTDESPRARAALERRMKRIFPALADVSVARFWGGVIGVTLDRLPQIGRLAPSLYLAQGYSGHGVNMTAIAARAIAEAITGEEARLSMFERFPMRPHGGRLTGPLRFYADAAWRMARDRF